MKVKEEGSLKVNVMRAELNEERLVRRVDPSKRSQGYVRLPLKRAYNGLLQKYSHIPYILSEGFQENNGIVGQMMRAEPFPLLQGRRKSRWHAQHPRW